MIIFIGVLFIIVLIILGIFRKFRKPKSLRTYNDYQSKAAEYLVKKDYDQAIEVKLQALELEGLSNIQKADLFYGIGGIYLENHDVETATDYFDHAFKVVADEEIPYDKRYIEVLDAYIQAGRRDDAEKLLESLLKRQSQNKKFKKLEKYWERL